MVKNDEVFYKINLSWKWQVKT